MYKHQYHESNYKREFNNDAFYNKIMIAVEKEIQRNLLDSERKETVSFIQKIDPDLLKPEFHEKSVKLMISTLSNEFKKYDCTKPFYSDSQQILREKIGLSSESGTSHGIYDNPGFFRKQQKPTPAPAPTPTPVEKTDNKIQKFLGLDNPENVARVINPSSMHRKNFIMLDSRYRILTRNDTSGIIKFSWNYIIKSQIEAQGSVNIVGNVRDIISIRVYPFRIPYVTSADNKYARISVFIEELGSQAFIAHEQRKYHFMLRSVIDSDFIDLETDKFNDGFFHFEKPITTLNTLTVSFGSPLEQVTFENDRSWCGIDYFVDAPLTRITTYTNSPVGSSIQPHNLSNGDRVYFELFDVGFINPALVEQDRLNQLVKSTINREEGFLITVVDANNFTIPFDSTIIQNPITDIRFRVFFGSKRIFIPMELTYIMPSVAAEY
jgi:hypothetical protein